MTPVIRLLIGIHCIIFSLIFYQYPIVHIYCKRVILLNLRSLSSILRVGTITCVTRYCIDFTETRIVELHLQVIVKIHQLILEF